MSYKLFLDATGEELGAASDEEMLFDLVTDLYHEDNIYPHEIRIEEVE